LGKIRAESARALAKPFGPRDDAECSQLPLVIGVFGALLCASALGVNLQRKLAERHKNKETGDHVRLIISILVTFTAVVVGLVISNVKSSYDEFGSRLNAFAGDITELDVRLREYGEETAPIRAKLRAYLAAAIADTWRNEPAPSGAYPRFPASASLERRQLGDMLIDADMAIGKLDPPDLFRNRLVTQIEEQMSVTMTQRRLVLGTSRDTISWSLLLAMTAWLVIVFAVFGVIAPRNVVVYVTILLCALSFSSAIELDTPVDGFIDVSSEPMRDALRHIDAS
jgi:hypothetical protein